MTRGEANALVQAGFRALGAAGGVLNPAGLASVLVGTTPIVFEYLEHSQALRFSALIYRFEAPAKAEVLAALRAHAAARGNDGGAELVYRHESRALMLERACLEGTDGRSIASEARALVRAALRWALDGIEEAMAASTLTNGRTEPPSPRGLPHR
jgi:hypothetical protein